MRIDNMLTLEGNIIRNNKIFRQRIEISDSGIINKIGDPNGNADFVFGDELIFPGFIDLHVHAREDVSHQEDYKEDFKTASAAAINGGVVAFCEMPNNPVPPIDDESYGNKKELAQQSPVEIVLYAGIGPKSKPLSRKVPYKVFMGKSVGDLFFKTLAELEETIKNYAGQHVSFHCENPEILEKYKNEPTHELRRPEEAEISGINFALNLIEKYKIFGKICHVSTVAGLRKIIAAKKRGVNVTVEITPHHLYFDTSMINDGNQKILQINPPLRSEADTRALIQFLKQGEIDFLATDHAPHTLEEKTAGISGLPHLDTFGPFTTWLMTEHNFTPQDIARVCAESPGRFWSKFRDTKSGELKAGFVGSLTVIDPNKPITIKKEMLKTKCGWSPFEGVTFPGSVVMTVVRGQILKNETN